MRGEKPAPIVPPTNAEGSPPHARGKESREIWETVIFKITPACAGKRDFERLDRIHQKDHPRMRGEKKSLRA